MDIRYAPFLISLRGIIWAPCFTMESEKKAVRPKGS